MKYNGVTLHHYPGPSTLSDQNETKGGKTSLTTSPENFWINITVNPLTSLKEVLRYIRDLVNEEGLGS